MGRKLNRKKEQTIFLEKASKAKDLMLKPRGRQIMFADV